MKNECHVVLIALDHLETCFSWFLVFSISNIAPCGSSALFNIVCQCCFWFCLVVNYTKNFVVIEFVFVAHVQVKVS